MSPWNLDGENLSIGLVTIPLFTVESTHLFKLVMCEIVHTS